MNRFFFILYLSLTLPQIVFAEQNSGPRQVRLMIPVCDELPFDVPTLIELLQIELSSDEVRLITHGDVEPPENQAILSLDVPECLAENPLILRLREGSSVMSVQRTIELDGIAGQERVIALAIAEILRRSWADLTSDPSENPIEEEANTEEQQETSEDELSDQERAAFLQLLEERDDRLATPEPDLGYSFDLSMEGLAVPAFETGFVGLLMGLSIPLLTGLLRLDIDFSTQYGMATDPLGAVDILLVNGGIAALFGNQSGSVRGGIGPRFEFGWSWVWGRPFDSSTRSDPFNSAYVSVGLDGNIRINLREGLWLLFGGRVGYIVVGFEATALERRASGLKGVLIGFGLGISFEI